MDTSPLSISVGSQIDEGDSHSPLLTVVMPVYNGGPELEDAVRSILVQSFRDWELLVLDDGSTDGAVERLELHQDERVVIVRGAETLGVAVRLNQGVQLARGLFLARMDADDVSFPERLSKQLQMLQSDSSLDLIGVRAITIDSADGVTGQLPQDLTYDAICARPWMGFHLAHPTWMGRTAWFRANPYAVPAPYACEDQELLLRTFRHSKFGCVADVLFAYRLRSEVDWEKLSRTRRAVLAFQWAEFCSAHNWAFAALSVAGYLLRSLRDLRARLSRKSHFPGQGFLPSDAVRSEWTRVLERVRA